MTEDTSPCHEDDRRYVPLSPRWFYKKGRGKKMRRAIFAVCVLSSFLLCACGIAQVENGSEQNVTTSAEMQGTIPIKSAEETRDKSTGQTEIETRTIQTGETVVLSIKNNNDAGNGVTLDVTAKGSQGPDDFAVVNDNHFLILDTAKQRILQFQNGSWGEPITLEDKECRILRTDGETVFMVGSANLWCLSLGTNEVTSYPFPQEEMGEFISEVYCYEGEIIVVSERFGNHHFDRTTKEWTPTTHGWLLDPEKKGKVCFNDRSWNIAAPYSGIEVLGVDPDGQLAVLLYNAPGEPAAADFCTVRKYDAEGRETLCLRVPTGVDNVYFPLRPAEMGVDGTIYMMTVTEEKTEIWK